MLNSAGQTRLFTQTPSSGNQAVIESVASDGAGSSSTRSPAITADVGVSNVWLAGT